VTVQIKSLTAGYGKHPVLHGINMQIGGGKLCALLGHNGSGKTTLMRCINAVLKPLEGKVVVMNKDVAMLSRVQIAKIVSFVPQSSHTAFSFSCLEMILMGGVSRMKMWSAPSRQDRQKAWQICEEVGIADFVLASFNQLSGGQKQLVMLARALYQDAPVMLLDEPNSHLDFGNQHKIMSLVQHIVKQRGFTALITLHDPNLALNYCDEVIMLKQGHIIASGPTELTLNDVNLQGTFGDNIKIDTTSSGVQVVVPRYLSQYT